MAADGYDYDLLVIGLGPAGKRAAIQGAKLDKRVAVERTAVVGGVSVNLGTIPSKNAARGGARMLRVAAFDGFQPPRHRRTRNRSDDRVISRALLRV